MVAPGSGQLTHKSNEKQIENACWVARLQLRRTGSNCALSLSYGIWVTGMSLAASRHSPRSSYQVINSITRDFPSSFHRCKSLFLYTPFNIGYSPPLDQKPVFARLECLRIYDAWWIKDALFEQTPVIKTIEFFSLVISRLFPLEWQRLENITLFLQDRLCYSAAYSLPDPSPEVPKMPGPYELSPLNRFIIS
jgi:hypothetical protein